MEKEKVFRNSDLPKSFEEFEERTEIPKIRNEFIAQLEHSLMFLSYKDTPTNVSDAHHKFSLKTFDGAWIMGQSLRHNEKDCFMLSAFGDDQVSPDMFPDLNIKTLNISNNIATLTKNRFLNPKEKRHLEKTDFISQYRYAWLDNQKRKWFTSEEGLAISRKAQEGRNGLKYYLPIPTPLKPGYIFRKVDILKRIEQDDYVECIKQLNGHLQLALTQYYEWTCYIRENQNSIGIRLPIHPSSSKEIFMMRNIPEGSNRRKAIVNYVKDHYRTIKGLGNEREILIKKHFRGELKFNWRGLEVHVTPSPYDLKRIKTSKKFM